MTARNLVGSATYTIHARLDLCQLSVPKTSFMLLVHDKVCNAGIDYKYKIFNKISIHHSVKRDFSFTNGFCDYNRSQTHPRILQSKHQLVQHLADRQDL